MKKRKLLNIVFFIVIYLVIGSLIIYNKPYNLDNRQLNNYNILAFSYFLIAGLLLATSMIRKMDIFEPIVLVTILYLMIFTITPIINIINNDTLCLGVDIMDGAVKATIIYIISIISYYTGYYFPAKYNKNEIKYNHIDDEETLPIFRVNLFIWIICYILTVIYIMSNGQSFMYILSLGKIGNVTVNDLTGTPLGFIGMFNYSLIPTWMYIWIYGKNKHLKWILGFLTMTTFLVRGFRFVVVITLFAPIIYHYLKKNKRPKLISIATMLSLTFIMIGVLGFTRNDIRSGNSIDWNNFNSNFIVQALKTNFDIYMPFYGLVDKIPSVRSYTFGQQFFYVIVIFIPRIIWHSKPLPIMKELIGISVSDYAIKAGVAWPNIGEFYSEFGIIGVIICMFIFGKLCSGCKKLYQNSNRNDHSLIAYSIILPALIQIVIRGYSPTNFYLMVFLLLPIILVNFSVKKKKGVLKHAKVW